MIELGLARVAQLAPKSYSWKAVHVAGTNGKGSICSYISAMVKAAGLRSARFTSPHLIDRWDCIALDEETINKAEFDRAEKSIKTKNDILNVNATEFELLTATAFDIFNNKDNKVDYGVVEVGLGGRLDATNVMTNVEISVISKIGLDHQAQLGNSIQEIAREKAGIMRPKVPCIVDGTNDVLVLETLRSHASQMGTPLSFVTLESAQDTHAELQPYFDHFDLDPHHRINAVIATEAVKTLMCRGIGPKASTANQITEGLWNTSWPGRLQRIDIGPLTGGSREVLLDGAHNVQSAEVLSAHIGRKIRNGEHPVTWVFAASQGKDIASILKSCLQKNDRIVPVRFGPVDGMPWVRSMDLEDISAAATQFLANGQVYHVSEDQAVIESLRMATRIASGGPLVIAGSLYLVSDILRLLRDHPS